MLLFVAGLLMAQAAAGTPPKPVDPKGDAIVCHSAQSDVGTHMHPKRVCMKKSEWDLVQANTDTQLDRIQDRGSFAPGMAEGGHAPH
jgi:hypothetical protein